MLAKQWLRAVRSVAGKDPGSTGSCPLNAAQTVAQNCEKRGWSGPRLSWILSRKGQELSRIINIFICMLIAYKRVGGSPKADNFYNVEIFLTIHII